MEIKIKLFASLTKNRFIEEIRRYEEGTNVKTVIEDINIPENEVFIIFVNNIHAGKDYLLKDGDTLALFPPSGGG